MTYYAPTPTYPGNTPAERLAWLMAHLSREEALEMAARSRDRRAWLRENNAGALAA